MLNGSGAPNGDESDATSVTSGTRDGDSDFDSGSFEPRDLDKHYAALRQSIHHVADGAQEPFGLFGPITPMSPIAEAKAMEHAHSDPGATDPAALGIEDDPNDETIRLPKFSSNNPAAAAATALGLSPTPEEDRQAPEGSIPNIIAISSNPSREASVNVPDTIPEASPIMTEPNPWDETPRQG